MSEQKEWTCKNCDANNQVCDCETNDVGTIAYMYAKSECRDDIEQLKLRVRFLKRECCYHIIARSGSSKEIAHYISMLLDGISIEGDSE